MRALLRSCSATGPPAPVEVKDCQGQKRDSMADFQENSILSPQQVEAATYQQVIDTNPHHQKRRGNGCRTPRSVADRSMSWLLPEAVENHLARGTTMVGQACPSFIPLAGTVSLRWWQRLFL